MNRLVLGAVLGVVLVSPIAAFGRDLTFEERVQAQGAIERVYHSHLDGTPGPFEEAVPLAVLEEKVRLYLRQSVALERVWSTSVTSTMLEAELKRIARDTHFPERLLEVYHALGDDAFLVQECFVRPILVSRLARNRFSRDETLHAAPRLEAEALRAKLAAGTISIDSNDPHRTVVELVRETSGKSSERNDQDRQVRANEADPVARVELDGEEFSRWRSRAPGKVGEIGAVVEERDAFVARVVLREDSDTVRIASYAVPKQSWDTWWTRVRGELDVDEVEPVASSTVSLPMPFESGSGLPDAACPDEDTWRNGVLDDIPEPRAGHTAIWTGSEMIVWGGIFSYLRTNTGARYNPATDTWVPTSTVGAPRNRFEHVAVWDGKEMIVWGGREGGDEGVNSGGRYDPLTDSWTETSQIDAPPGIYLPSAVWTGTEMIVWGGCRQENIAEGGLFGLCEYDSTSDRGGRYDPAADRWMPVSLLRAPQRRYKHTAIWDGREMIVWGGIGGHGDHHLATGGRYDPATNTWTTTSMIGVPERRKRHTAVWTGREMLIWGGDEDRLLSGGRYDPASDQWAPMSTSGSEGARSEHTAVWTGSEMIVWGGIAGAVYSRTGSRYDPVSGSLDSHEHSFGSLRCQRSYRRLDGKRDDRLGWSRLRVRARGLAVRPARRHLDPDERDQRAFGALGAHGGLDRKSHDRLGRAEEQRRCVHRWSVRPDVGFMEADDVPEHTLRAIGSRRRVDRESHDRLGRNRGVRRAEHWRAVRPGCGHMAGDDPHERAVRTIGHGRGVDR